MLQDLNTKVTGITHHALLLLLKKHVLIHTHTHTLRYVERLEEILNTKMTKIMDLKSKLGRFKEHLKEEELMSKTLGPAGARKW